MGHPPRGYAAVHFGVFEGGVSGQKLPDGVHISRSYDIIIYKVNIKYIYIYYIHHIYNMHKLYRMVSYDIIQSMHLCTDQECTSMTSCLT